MDLSIAEQDFQPIGQVEIPDIFYNRLRTGNMQLDAMFGGPDIPGILPGSTLTLKAKPGVGKSVFALVLGEMLTNAGYKVILTTGEEDIKQVAFNCQRLKVENLRIGVKTHIDDILSAMEGTDFLIADSFQTLKISENLTRTKKIEYLVDNLVSHAKNKVCSTLFIVQETVTGEMRGGTILPYAVDVNMEILKDKEDKSRRLINIYKNRFGPCSLQLTTFGKNGYEFLGECDDNEIMNTKETKTSIKVIRKNLLMNHDGLLTLNGVENILGVSSQTARILLVELENDMKLLKYGRGDNAIWKKNTIV